MLFHSQQSALKLLSPFPFHLASAMARKYDEDQEGKYKAKSAQEIFCNDISKICSEQCDIECKRESFVSFSGSSE